MLTKQLVEQMDEKELRKRVLIPLLRAMGYQDVYEYHGGSGEQGKDIVCWQTSILGNPMNLAVVVKSKAVTGKANVAKGTAGEIQTQIQQCFGSPFTDPITGNNKHVNHCWVISNKSISKEAISAIKSALGNSVYRENVEFVGIDKLWELIEKYLPPQAALQKLEEARDMLENWDTHYRLQASITETGIEFSATEKFPGASAEKPINFKTVFTFPDTEEGRHYAEAMEKYFADGTPVKIPLAYLKDFELPDFMQQILPQMTEDGFFLLGRAYNPKPLLVQVEFLTDDGDCCSLDYLDLRVLQAGSEEVTFTNDDQKIPAKVKLIMRFNGSPSSIHIELQHSYPINIHQLLLELELLNCLSKPHLIRITNLETGISTGMGRQEANCEFPASDAIEVARALNALQIKTGRPVFWPERELTSEEVQIIEQLRVIFRTGQLKAGWDSITIGVEATQEKIEELRQWLEGEKIMSFPVHAEEFITLFGLIYPLGKIKPNLLTGKLLNEQEVREKLAQAVGNEDKIELKFIPVDNDSFIKEYLDWVPEADQK